MSGTTTDPSDPRLTHGSDAEPVEQAEVYLVLSEEERSKGFVRPFRDAYRHVGRYHGETIDRSGMGVGCGSVTTMGRVLSETYARDPKFYSGTYCVHCKMHRPVAEFVWEADGLAVGS